MYPTPLQFPLNLANGQQSFKIPGAPYGTQQVMFACATYPNAGATLSLEYLLVGETAWRPVPKGTLLPLTGPIVLETYGAVAQYRVTLTSVVGGSNLAAWFGVGDSEGFPPNAFIGLRALTVQNYTEANVKNGTQYELSSYQAAVAAAANVDTIFTTGPNPVLIKARQIGFDGKKLEAHVYSNPTFSGGAVIPYFNLNQRNQVPGNVVVRGGATVTVLGTEVAAPSYLIGSTSNGNTTLGTYAVTGNERLLAANTTYLLRITNTDVNPQQVAVYVSWYEGGTDLPV